MPIIFDVLYREFCRARLAEMRKQLLLSHRTPIVPGENCETGHPCDAVDSQGLEVALDMEQLLFEATTLLNAASLVNRIAQQG